MISHEVWKHIATGAAGTRQTARADLFALMSTTPALTGRLSAYDYAEHEGLCSYHAWVTAKDD